MRIDVATPENEMADIHAVSAPRRQPARSTPMRANERPGVAWTAYAAFLLSVAFASAVIFGLLP